MSNLHPMAEELIDRIMADARPEPGLKPGEDYRITRQVLADCIGDRRISPRYIFWVCLQCQRLRCTRELIRFTSCLCGSTRVRPWEQEIDTKWAAKTLAECIARERAQKSIMLRT